MIKKEDLSCPVDFIAVNEYKIRLIALQVFVLSVIVAITGCWYIIAFLLLDFLLRMLNLGTYSLLALLAGAMVKLLNIGNKPVDRAPKRFAAGVGTVFTALILCCLFLNWHTAEMVLIVMLCCFSFLESFIGFCAGCYVYTLLQKMFKGFK